jgi:hypothetical protein
MPNGRWSGSTRRERLPANWRQLCREARELYGTSCYLCGHGDAVDTDHLIAGDNHDVANLRAICGRGCQECRALARTPCHVVKSSREGGLAAQAARPRRNREPERHPGMRQPWP